MLTMISIRITSRPGGEAPEGIRDKWIGLTLPVDNEYSGKIRNVISGSFAGFTNGYAVRWEDAMQALDEETRAWWSHNVCHLPRLIFSGDCCEVVA